MSNKQCNEATGRTWYRGELACPFCESHAGTSCLDTRGSSSRGYIRRRRQCLGCGEKFTTHETAAKVDESLMDTLRAAKESARKVLAALEHVR